jgi:protein O-GlcNAc transferase
MRIAFFCYPSGTDAWSPSSTDEGIGGSEEAVIHMAARFAESGHEVAVYNRRRGDERYADGVRYAGYDRLADESIDVGVVWRRPGLWQWLLGGARSGRIYLWLHDAIGAANFEALLGVYRKVVVLSRFHRMLYPSVANEKFLVSSNGIEPSHFAGFGRRDPQLIVYGSSYNRGLCTLLENWGRIREAVPDARLNIFYGWEVFERLSPARCAVIRPYYERLMTQEGITHLWRVSHREVARQYSTAGVWAYPCSFPETSCISAMKAQAGGAIPVVIPTGALRETVKFGFATMRSYTDFRGLRFPRRIIDEWLDGLIAILRAPQLQERIRSVMVPRCISRFDWRRVAQQWEREFAAA